VARNSASQSAWRAFETNEITHSGAHYLLAIGAAAKEGPPPRAAAVARALGVSRAAASLQLRVLAGHGYVRLDKGQGLHLTRPGADLVARVRSKREVVRVFLSEILGVRPVTAEADACKIEHLLSEETGAATVRLIRFLHSEHPAARACLDAFRAMTAGCPPGQLCDLCVRSCLLAGALRTETSGPANGGPRPTPTRRARRQGGRS
jgi:DtxR family transcriptional regulator, Mn-dependent transcriptional regulator